MTKPAARSSSTGPIISVNNVTRVFRSPQKAEGFKNTIGLLLNPKHTEHIALKDVSFTIEPGSFVGLIGANGAGKTTLLKILAGLIPPTSGEVSVLGLRPFDRTMEFRHTISLAGALRTARSNRCYRGNHEGPSVRQEDL